jgi:arylsulfatase A
MRRLLALLMLPAIVATANDAAQPNIIFILADDLGWSDLACYGHPYHRTPNLNRLAKEGLRLTNAYSPAPICSAARASILTGKTPARLNFEFVTKDKPGGQQLDITQPLRTPKLTLNLPLSEMTIAEEMATLGYTTAFFGKWHVNQHYEGRYLAWHPDYGPAKQGFQFATEDFGDHPYAWRHRPVGPDLPRGEFPADSMIDGTAQFIRAHSDSDKPFFLMASSFYVHTPVKNRCRWLVGDYDSRVAGVAANRTRRLEYAAFIETLDHHVGTILDAIDDSGQRDDTLVVLMSDNGGHPEFCSNAPLRGSKWNLYEGGIRVPMMMRWPKKVAAGTTCDTPVIGYDLLPTFVSIAGGNLQSDGELDGIDISRLLADPAWKPRRDLLWHFPYYHPEKTFSAAQDEIGVDDFAVSKTRPQSALRRGNYKLIHFAEDDRIELFDLEKDIAEQQDLSTKHPAIALELRRALANRLNAMNARRAAPRRENEPRS